MMPSMVPLLPYPDNSEFLKTAYSIYKQYKQYTQALLLAIRLNDTSVIEEVFNSTKDKSTRRQMAILLGRQRICIELSDEDTEEDPDLADCINNTHRPFY